MTSQSDLGIPRLVLALSKGKVLLGLPMVSLHHKVNLRRGPSCLLVCESRRVPSSNKPVLACKVCQVKVLRVHKPSLGLKASSNPYRAYNLANNFHQVKDLRPASKGSEDRLVFRRDRLRASKLVKCRIFNSNSSLAQDPCNLRTPVPSRTATRLLSNGSSQDLDLYSRRSRDNNNMVTKAISIGSSQDLVRYSLRILGPSHMVCFLLSSNSFPGRGRCRRRTQGPDKAGRKLLTIDSSLELGRYSPKANPWDHSQRSLSNMHRQTSNRDSSLKVASKASRAVPSRTSSQLPTRDVLKVQWLLTLRALYKAGPKTHSMVLDSLSNNPCHKHHFLSNTRVNRALSRVY